MIGTKVRIGRDGGGAENRTRVPGFSSGSVYMFSLLFVFFFLTPVNGIQKEAALINFA